MVKAKRRPPTSVKQILVRDHNWLMGNLRRNQNSLWGVSELNQERIHAILSEEMALQQSLHEKRLHAAEAFIERGEIPDEEMQKDTILLDAFQQATRNQRQMGIC